MAAGTTRTSYPVCASARPESSTVQENCGFAPSTSASDAWPSMRNDVGASAVSAWPGPCAAAADATPGTADRAARTAVNTTSRGRRRPGDPNRSTSISSASNETFQRAAHFYGVTRERTSRRRQSCPKQVTMWLDGIGVPRLCRRHQARFPDPSARWTVRSRYGRPLGVHAALKRCSNWRTARPTGPVHRRGRPRPCLGARGRRVRWRGPRGSGRATLEPAGGHGAKVGGDETQAEVAVAAAARPGRGPVGATHRW